MTHSALWALALAGLALPAAEACSSMVVGKKASVDGSILSFHTDDADGSGGQPLTKIPEQDWPANATHRTGIPQVPHTYGYYRAAYPSLNQWQVGMVESTSSAVYATKSRAEGGDAYLGMSDLMGLGLERAKTAREAIQVMGDLAVKWGFHGEDPFPSGGETVFVHDTEEAWVVHFLTDPTGKSAIWGAGRIPDDHVAAVMNCFILREMDLNDRNHYMASENIREQATILGWNPSLPLDFSLYFSVGEYGHQYYSGRRVWRGLSMLAPSLDLNPYYGDYIKDRPYPFSVKPDKLVGVEDLIAITRDYYDGTEFDTHAGLAAGPFGSPRRWAGATGNVQGWFERTIALQRTDLVNLLQVRGDLPNEIGAVMWHAPHTADGAVFVPFPVGFTPDQVPKAFSEVPKKFNRDTAYWLNVQLYNVMEIKYSYMVKDVRRFQQASEAKAVQLVKDMDKAYAAAGNDISAVVKSYVDHANEVIRQTSDVSDLLIQHYPDGYCNGCGEGIGHEPPYPDWWLKAVGYEHPKINPPSVEAAMTVDACVDACPEDSLAAYKQCVKTCVKRA